MISYTTHNAPFEAQHLAAMHELVQRSLSPSSPDDFLSKVREKHHPMAVIGWSDAQPVGFKLGYAQSQQEFYSWLGGVHPDFRRRGIASALMKKQHQALIDLGYSLVSTQTLNTNRAMLMLNLQHGFIIHGVRHDDRGLKVLLTLDLSK